MKGKERTEEGSDGENNSKNAWKEGSIRKKARGK